MVGGTKKKKKKKKPITILAQLMVILVNCVLGGEIGKVGLGYSRGLGEWEVWWVVKCPGMAGTVHEF